LENRRTGNGSESRITRGRKNRALKTTFTVGPLFNLLIKFYKSDSFCNFELRDFYYRLHTVFLKNFIFQNQSIKMNKTFALFLALLAAFQLKAQVQLSGVINQYSKVTFIENDICQNKIKVTDIAPFAEGQFVVLMQMQGATINESNSSSFGDISNLNNAGFYEINEIISIDGFDIYLKYQNHHEYDINGKVQLISMPNYEDANVVDTLTAAAWNGETGGVLALNISGQLLLNANIEVSGLGFRGGETQTASNNNCTWIFQQNDYFYGFGNWRGAAKGEGIAPVILEKEFGKGPQANGGGGGNDHNSGGGGGANISNGGAGGENDEPQIFGCQGNHPGLGGKAIGNIDNRIFLGGGGGAGHDNNEVATNGSNGGGIVILIVEELIPVGFSILANGNSTVDGGGDGAGGGGGGGSIFLDVQSLNSTIDLEVNGGAGGMVDNGGLERCHGPGGGGSGGRIITNLTSGSSLATSVGGGSAGVSINSSTCSDGTNGAENGENGIIEEINNNIFASQDFQFPEASFSFTNSMLVVNFSNLSQNTTTTIWDFGDGNSSADANPIHTYSQTGTYNVQLIVSNDCGVDTFNQAIFVEIIVADFLIDAAGGCVLHTVNFQNNSLGTIDNFSWTFAGGNPATSMDENPQVIYNTSGLFEVQLEIFGASGSDALLMENAIAVLEVPVASFDYFFSTQGTANFNNNSTNATFYEWDFGDGTPVANVEMPFHVYNSEGDFVVTLTAFNEYCSNTFTDTVSILTNLPELGLSDVRIFPNPSSDFITIELQDSEVAQIEVFSMDGKKIKSLSGTFFQSRLLDIRSLPRGVFTISIIQNKKRGLFRWVRIN
jgi:PKD repeat protein